MSSPLPGDIDPICVQSADAEIRERLELLAEAAASLLTTEDPQAYIRTLYAKVSRHLELEIYFNYLLNEDGDRLCLDSWSGIDEETAANLKWLALGQGISGYAAAQRTRIVIENAQQRIDSRTQLIRAQGVNAYACFPLIGRGRIAGTLSFGSRHRNKFELDELDLMETIATQVAVAMDRARLIRDLQQSASDWRTLSEAVPVMVFTTDAQGRLDYFNQRWYDFTGLALDESRGFGWTVALHPDELPAVLERWTAAVQTGSPYEGEHRFRCSDGTFRWFLARSCPLRNHEGRIVKWFGTCMDVEDHKRADDASRRAQQFERLSILAGGVAHQFNNLLTGIIGGSSVALDLLPQHHPARAVLQQVIATSERAAKLSGQMLAYSGRGRFLVRPVNLSELVRNLDLFSNQELLRKVEVKLDLASALPLVDADDGQLCQLVTNLTTNAVEAIGENAGVVRIWTGTYELHNPGTGKITDELPPGNYACIEIQDTGCGMDEAVLARIFDPFFTTKFMGRGLGLAAALGIVRGHKGALQVHSVPGQGSTFRVLLPISQRQPIAPR